MIPLINKSIYMIAGPNGSGKTTTAHFLLGQHLNFHEIYEYINADEIARGLAPLHPQSMNLTASKLMITRLRELLAANQSFAFETTGAGKNYLTYLQQAKNKGYEINLLYLWLKDEDLAVKRVAQRVSQGGHNIPEGDIRRRYKQGIKFVMKYYLPYADNALFIDNSIVNAQELIARKSAEELQILDINRWEHLQRLSNA